jgi:hypothetical protein
MVRYPAACCRNCGAAVIWLGQVKLEVAPEGKRGVHLTTCPPSKCDPCVRVQPHHDAGQHHSFGTVVNKISKVYCQVCDHNLGNVQQFVERQECNTLKYHAERWHLKTVNVGFRRCAADDASVVRVFKSSTPFTKFVRLVGAEDAIRELPIQLPAEHCAHYKPGGVFELEGALAIAPERELDAVREKLANARIDRPEPPTARQYEKKLSNITLSVVAERPPRRRPPRSDDLRQLRCEATADRQAREHDALTRRGEALLGCNQKLRSS